ncbi:MAG: GspE/PulE family protein, partial [Mycobacteriales bacterium]
MWSPSDVRSESGGRHSKRATDAALTDVREPVDGGVETAPNGDTPSDNGRSMPNPADSPFFAPGPTDQPVLRRRRIGEVLVSMGVLTEEQLLDCLAAQAKSPTGRPRKRLGAIIVDRKLATERQVIQALADAMQLPVVDLAVTPVSASAARLIPRAVAERHLILGLKLDGNVLTVATSDPTNIVALDDVRLYAKTEVSWVVASERAIRQHLNRIWSIEEDASDITTLFEEDDFTDEALADGAGAEATPVVRLVNAILADAVRAEASDIHIEPQLKEVRVRFRVDGLLRDVMKVPRSAAAGVISRIKIVSGLDIAERRRPQDGRTRLHVDDESIDARV